MPPYSKLSPSSSSSYPSARHRRCSSSLSSSSSAYGSDEEGTKREGRLLLRHWLIEQAEKGEIPGLKWLDREKTLLRVPWTHASRQGFDSKKDSFLYRAWAEYQGRCGDSQNKKEHKRWKANFRCAMNSLPDVRAEDDLSDKKVQDAYKVYRFLTEVPRKSLIKNTTAINVTTTRTCTKAKKKELLKRCQIGKKQQQTINQQKLRQIKCTKAISTNQKQPSQEPVRNKVIFGKALYKSTQLQETLVTLPESVTTQSMPTPKQNVQVIPTFVEEESDAIVADNPYMLPTNTTELEDLQECQNQSINQGQPPQQMEWVESGNLPEDIFYNDELSHAVACITEAEQLNTYEQLTTDVLNCQILLADDVAEETSQGLLDNTNIIYNDIENL